MDIAIIVASHKKYDMPEDSIYIPLQVGAENRPGIGFLRDDSGDNISGLNPGFCELTGLYWAWKNLHSDYKGLVQYRRHFLTANKKLKRKKKSFPLSAVMGRSEMETILQETDIIVAKKRNYYIESVYDHYAHTLYVEPLDETREIIKDICPEYLAFFDEHMKDRGMHAFNMFVMKSDKFDAYCNWLFSILFELEKRFHDVKYNEFHARFYGRVSELLLDVWLGKNGYSFKEVPFLYTEKIHYGRKILGFITSKLFHKKYEQSC